MTTQIVCCAIIWLALGVQFYLSHLDKRRGEEYLRKLRELNETSRVQGEAQIKGLQNVCDKLQRISEANRSARLN